MLSLCRALALSRCRKVTLTRLRAMLGSMPTVTVVYDLPREKHDLETALVGADAVEALDAMDAYLQSARALAETPDARTALQRALEQLRALRRGERDDARPRDDAGRLVDDD